jgi:hypothetical protein
MRNPKQNKIRWEDRFIWIDEVSLLVRWRKKCRTAKWVPHCIITSQILFQMETGLGSLWVNLMIFKIWGFFAKIQISLKYRYIESNQTIWINEIIPDIKPIHATDHIFSVTVKSRPRKPWPPVIKKGKFRNRNSPSWVVITNWYPK